MKRVSRSLSYFTSPGIVDSPSSGVTGKSNMVRISERANNVIIIRKTI